MLCQLGFSVATYWCHPWLVMIQAARFQRNRSISHRCSGLVKLVQQHSNSATISRTKSNYSFSNGILPHRPVCAHGWARATAWRRIPVGAIQIGRREQPTECSVRLALDAASQAAESQRNRRRHCSAVRSIHNAFVVGGDSVSSQFGNNVPFEISLSKRLTSAAAAASNQRWDTDLFIGPSHLQMEKTGKQQRTKLTDNVNSKFQINRWQQKTETLPRCWGSINQMIDKLKGEKVGEGRQVKIRPTFLLEWNPLANLDCLQNAMLLFRMDRNIIVL